MRGLHLVAILLVLVREHATKVPKCPGEFNVTDVALPQDRPVTVGFSPNPSTQENVTYAWVIIFLKESKRLKPEECLKQYNMTVEEHGSTLRISWIPMGIDVRITVMRDGKMQCYKDARLNVLKKPSEPILGQLRGSGLDGCDRCLFLPHKEQHPTILCDVEGGAAPLNVTMFIDSRAYTPSIASRDRNTRNKHYKLTVDRAQLQHRSDVRCEVMSPALVEPLIATAHVYIEVPPINVTLTLNDVTIRHTGIVRCDSKGMRPAVNITAYFDCDPCVPNRTVTLENKTDAYDVTTTYSFTGEKSLHRKPITCCIGSKQKICSSEKYLNILFPPDTVSANQSVLVSGQPNVTVRCSVSEANPSCDINWRVSEGIQGVTTERQLDNTAGDLDGRYAQISELSLQRNPKHNGQQIACTVKCDNFDVIEKTVTLNIPGPPLITITPGTRITRTEGDALQLNCTVNNHLSTKTQWSFYGNKSCDNVACNEVGKSFEDRSVECGTYSRCFDFESLARSDTGFYACVVETKEFGSTKQHVALEVISPELQSGTVDHILNQTWFVPTTIGIAILLLLLLVIGIVVWRTRKRARKLDEPKGGAAGQEDGPPIEENEGSVHEEGEQDVLQVGSNHGDGQMYASVVPRSQRQQQANQNERPNPGSDQSVHQGASNHGDGQMYASVLPRSQRQQQANQNEVQPSGSNQLVYVELDFQPTKPASKPEAGSHVESNATDYVSIDFNKTAQVNSGSDKTPYMNM